MASYAGKTFPSFRVSMKRVQAGKKIGVARSRPQAIGVPKITQNRLATLPPPPMPTTLKHVVYRKHPRPPAT